MKVHSFNQLYLSSECIYCKVNVGYSGWQLRHLTKSMANCPYGRKLWPWERLMLWLTDSIDCTK